MRPSPLRSRSSRSFSARSQGFLGNLGSIGAARRRPRRLLRDPYPHHRRRSHRRRRDRGRRLSRLRPGPARRRRRDPDVAERRTRRREVADRRRPDARAGVQASSPVRRQARSLAGEWTVGAGSVAGYRVREQLANLPAESDAVGRTEDVSGSITSSEAGDGAQLTAGSRSRSTRRRSSPTRAAATTGCATRASRPTSTRRRRSP